MRRRRSSRWAKRRRRRWRTGERLGAHPPEGELSPQSRPQAVSGRHDLRAQPGLCAGDVAGLHERRQVRGEAPRGAAGVPKGHAARAARQALTHAPPRCARRARRWATRGTAADGTPAPRATTTARVALGACRSATPSPDPLQRRRRVAQQPAPREGDGRVGLRAALRGVLAQRQDGGRGRGAVPQRRQVHGRVERRPAVRAGGRRRAAAHTALPPTLDAHLLAARSSGWGRIDLANGDSYEGMWKADVIHGKVRAAARPIATSPAERARNRAAGPTRTARCTRASSPTGSGPRRAPPLDPRARKSLTTPQNRAAS